jgi:hypothetical protein
MTKYPVDWLDLNPAIFFCAKKSTGIKSSGWTYPADSAKNERALSI